MKMIDAKGNLRFTPRRLLNSSMRRLREPILYGKLTAAARVSRSAITDPSSDVVISLTTHGARLRHVHLTLESIALGRVLPRRVILFLDEPKPHLSPQLGRLIERGLEIKTTSGKYGPHTKYYPFLVETERQSGDSLLVTADDDVIYPPSWLESLRSAYRPGQAEVLCHRAHRFKLNEGTIAPYNSWSFAGSTVPSILNMATGVSGVLYPPEMQESLTRFGEGFREKAPKADDIWLHWVALQSGLKIRQVEELPLELPTIWKTQSVSLLSENIDLSMNDVQIGACYSDEDVEMLLAAKAVELG